MFNVVQTGTKVIEDKNVGLLDQFIKDKNNISPEILIPKYIELCSKYHTFIKEHNGDYLSNETLMAHRYLEIQVVNVAPEFAISETRALIKIMREYDFKKELDIILEISYNSKKWKKWLSNKSKLNNFEKSVLSMHYIYSKSDFKEIKNKINSSLSFDLDAYLRKSINSSIIRYLSSFGYYN